MRKLLVIILLGVSLVAPMQTLEEVNQWWIKQRKIMKSGKSLNMPDVKPEKVHFADNIPRIGTSSLFLPSAVTRKEYRCLNSKERSNLHSAFQKTKQTMEGTLSQYDYFVSQHISSKAIAAHFGPAFAPWHRHYLYQFEKVLQSHCADCAIPYWDNRLEKLLGGNPQDSILFSPLLAGNANGPVLSGFAGNWTAPVWCTEIHPTLRRNFDDNVLLLFEDATVRFVETVTSHEQMSMDWDDRFETPHGYVHAAFGVGSHMINLMCSPTDPMFLMHHSFIDNLFERARNNIKRRNPPLKWADVNNLPAGSDSSIATDHAPNAIMSPFNIRNSVGLLDESYTTSYYNYERSPGDVRGCRSDSDCCAGGYTAFIWCYRTTGRCLPKVITGGSVDPSFPSKACHCSGTLRFPYIRNRRCRCRFITFQPRFAKWFEKLMG